ncbi:MAG: inositol monophosphatase [Acidimicrobiales bacterium]|nr:inositol monophosphatase [Acidimicrobiales bacterium]MYD84650.1 inositol monophosphatase [Acidimicrobiales bacterium]MYJ64599.1 inositol monophosphatase [Acidimicrobiales bacterium]
MTPAELEAVAVDVAGSAAAFLRGVTGTGEALRTKSTPTDVVTAVDIQSEEFIRGELLRRCPDSSIVGEELADEVGGSGVGWIVDPIDGTVNFLYDLPVFAVSIAATRDGTVVAGAVADVLRGEVFSAALGSGARLDDAPIAAASSDGLAQALVATGFSYHAERRRQQAAALARVLPATRDVRAFGSAALHLCWVANGRCDAFFEHDLRVYDWAAGALIATESGAQVELPDELNDDLVFAASPTIFGPLRELIVG